MPNTRGIWLLAAIGQTLRHSPGATKNRIGSSGTITWNMTNRPAAGRTNSRAITVRYAAMVMTRADCQTRNGTFVGSSLYARNRSRSPVGSIPRIRSASVMNRECFVGGGGGGGGTEVALSPIRVESCSSSSPLSSTDGGCSTMISDRPRRRTSPGASAARPVRAVPLIVVPLRLPRSTAESEVGLGTSRRCSRDTPSSASASPGQSRPIVSGWLRSRRRAGRPHSRISISGGLATIAPPHGVSWPPPARARDGCGGILRFGRHASRRSSLRSLRWRQALPSR